MAGASPEEGAGGMSARSASGKGFQEELYLWSDRCACGLFLQRENSQQTQESPWGKREAETVDSREEMDLRHIYWQGSEMKWTWSMGTEPSLGFWITWKGLSFISLRQEWGNMVKKDKERVKFPFLIWSEPEKTQDIIQCLTAHICYRALETCSWVTVLKVGVAMVSPESGERRWVGGICWLVYIILKQPRVIWEEETFIEKMSP